MKTIKFNNAEFSKDIQNYRLKNDCTLSDIKDITGISIATISRIENGKTPDLLTFKKICDWLKVSLDTYFK